MSDSDLKTPLNPIGSEGVVYIMKLIEARRCEIKSLNAECKQKLPKLASQQLPRFMRRRAASHNPKRVPASVRLRLIGNKSKTHGAVDKPEGNQKEDKLAPGQVKSRKSSTNHKNKAKQLRSLKYRLEKPNRTKLHLWFAKRFHFKEEYGTLIPFKNATKNQRILYRQSKCGVTYYYEASLKCLMISYEDLNILKSSFSQFINRWRPSNEEESIGLIHDPKSPKQFIGPCLLLLSENSRQLLLWVHAAILARVKEILSHTLASSCSIIDSSLHRIRLVGPKSWVALNRLGVPVQEKETCNRRFGSIMCYQKESGKKEEFITTSLNSILAHPSESKSELDVPLNQNLSLVVVLSGIFDALKQKRVALDLICDAKDLSILWTKLAANRIQLVGGQRDAQHLALNCSSLYFPSIGYCDSVVNYDALSSWFSENFKEYSNVDLHQDQRLHIIRDQHSKCDIKDPLALVNIKFRVIGKGVPVAGENLCLPTQTDIEIIQKLGSRQKRRLQAEGECLQIQIANCPRTVIGMVEQGCHSWEIGNGVGMGFMRCNALPELRRRNQTPFIEQACSQYGYQMLDKKFCLLIKSCNRPIYRVAEAELKFI